MVFLEISGGSLNFTGIPAFLGSGCCYMAVNIQYIDVLSGIWCEFFLHRCGMFVAGGACRSIRYCHDSHSATHTYLT